MSLKSLPASLLLLLRQFGELLSLPWRAAYDRRAYVAVVTEGVGIGLGVLLLATFIGTLGIVGNLYWLMADTFKREAPHYLAGLPTLTISEGLLNLPEETPLPLLIRHAETGAPLLLVDPRTDERPGEPADLRAFLGQSKLQLRLSTSWQDAPLKMLSDGVYDRARLEAFLRGLPLRRSLGIFPDLWMRMIIYQLTFIFILGVGTWMLLRGQDRPEYAFAPVLRLAGLAMCPAFLLTTTLGLLGLPEQTTLICYLFVFVGYLYFGVQSLREHLRRREFIAPPALTGRRERQLNGR